MKAYPDTIPTGEEHGTITFRNRGEHYEITTLRTESGYNDGRRPDEVEWGDSLLVDLSRRDLTMNSIAVNVTKERITILTTDAKTCSRNEFDPSETLQGDFLKMPYAFYVPTDLWIKGKRESGGLI